MEKTAPKKACAFSNKEANSFAMLASGSDEGKEKKLSITGYSGGIIENHWYWGNLAIDTKGIRFKKDKYPILFEHNTDRRIGFSAKPEIIDNKLVVNEGTLLDNEDAIRFASDCEKGFPFEASVYVEPTRIQSLNKGEETEVNGFTFSGPGTVFRECVYKEVSACGFGWDSNTSSTVGFSKDGVDDTLSYTVIKQEKEMPFDIEKFKAENPEDYAKFAASVAEPLNEEIQSLKTKLAEKEQAVDNATKLSNELSDRISKLERENLLREERETKAAFSAKVTHRLEKSTLPARLHAKFAATVNMEQFMVEGKFDEEKFSTFMDAELKDWEEAIPAPSVMGGGSSSFSKEPAGTHIDEDSAENAFGGKDAYAAFLKNIGIENSAE